MPPPTPQTEATPPGPVIEICWCCIKDYHLHFLITRPNHTLRTGCFVQSTKRLPQQRKSVYVHETREHEEMRKMLNQQPWKRRRAGFLSGTSGPEIREEYGLCPTGRHATTENKGRDENGNGGNLRSVLTQPVRGAATEGPVADLRAYRGVCCGHQGQDTPRGPGSGPE